MAKMKGLFKGIKYISQIFVFKEHEMEIGYPTDVRHVTHIGYDSGASMSSPSWMKEFKASSDFSSTSLGEQPNETSWASQGLQRPSEVLVEQPCPDVPKAPKKVKRKKLKSSSPSSTSRSSAKSSKTRTSCAASMKVEDGIPEPILVN